VDAVKRVCVDVSDIIVTSSIFLAAGGLPSSIWFNIKVRGHGKNHRGTRNADRVYKQMGMHLSISC